MAFDDKKVLARSEHAVRIKLVRQAADGLEKPPSSGIKACCMEVQICSDESVAVCPVLQPARGSWGEVLLWVHAAEEI